MPFCFLGRGWKLPIARLIAVEAHLSIYYLRMAMRIKVEPESLVGEDAALPVVCVVTTDQQFLDELVPELIPWFQVVLRADFEDLARWTREAGGVAVLLDIDTAEEDGKEVQGGLPALNELRKLNQDFILISLSRSHTRTVEKRALEAGAGLHFRSPVDISELRLALITALDKRIEDLTHAKIPRQTLESSRFQEFIGGSEPMRFVYDAIQQVADSNVNVLIRGESGTGKELAARAIVALSRRAKKPFIRLNCAALPENLIESELFGSERGAFTGASTRLRARSASAFRNSTWTRSAPARVTSLRGATTASPPLRIGI